jgi:hypothetical protein
MPDASPSAPSWQPVSFWSQTFSKECAVLINTL